MSITVQRCTSCAALHFPARLICPECAKNVFEATEVKNAVVDETTTTADGTVLATVRAGNHLRVIARLIAPAPAGTEVGLTHSPEISKAQAFVPAASSDIAEEPLS